MDTDTFRPLVGGSVEEATSQDKRKTKGLVMAEAIHCAIARAMEEDSAVVVFGEDIARNGGVFRVTNGLLERFGAFRVRDTPLSESGIAGIAVGASIAGLRPIAEIQFFGFSYSALDQIINHVARMRYRTRGKLACPIVFRAPYGAGVRSPEHHSESTEAIYAHIPGLRVVIPSTPKRSYGLLLAAIRCNDPVFFLEPTRMYREPREEFLDDGAALPLDTCFVETEGNDVTIVSWGAMLKEVREAARLLKEKGIGSEVIDIATLGATWDSETVVRSVAKTGKCVVVHEAPFTGGFGAEIAATVSHKAILSLFAPVERVAGLDIPPPYFQNEWHYMPSVTSVMRAVNRTFVNAGQGSIL